MIDLGGVLDDALAQGKAAREIAEIGRACHHHGVRDAVIDQRHRHFLDQHVQPVEVVAVETQLPQLDGRDDRGKVPGCVAHPVPRLGFHVLLGGFGDGAGQ